MSTKNLGFTLIELMVTVALSIILMLSASALFMTFLISSTKTSATQLIKSEGDFALSQMEFLIRNAVELLPNTLDQTCATNMDEISFKSSDNGVTTLFAEDDNGIQKIASNSGIYLTSDVATLTDGVTFDCQASDDDLSQYITITFTLRKGTPGVSQPTEIVEETFTTSVNLRSL